MAKAVMVVLTGPVSAEVEDEYNDWYSNKHVHDLARMPQVVAATRYRLQRDTQPDAAAPIGEQEYLAIYELDASSPQELEAFLAELRQRAERGDVDASPALDATGISASFGLLIGERVDGAGDPDAA